MKTFKKILASLLVVVMVLTAAPLSGFVGLELPDFDFGIRASAYNVSSSGSCGKNVTYTYNNSTGELVISGTGPMTNYGSYSGSPFYNSDIKSVVIEDGVTSIAVYAFFDCNSLTSVTIPDSVTTIAYQAFYSCDNLTTVTIPESVTAIGEDAFGCCYGLTSITVDADNTAYSSDSTGVLFDKNKTVLIQYPASNTNSSYTIPDSVTTIGDIAFLSCDSLTSVTIPDSVTTIGSDAFNSCDNLISVIIGNGVSTIGDCAFNSCDSLTCITIPDSVTTIGYKVFSHCDSLTSITIGDSVTTIGGDTFYNTGYYNNSSNWENDVLYIGEYLIKANSSLSDSYSIKEGTKLIADSTFYNCSSLTSVTIPDSVTRIGNNAFYNCNSLTSVTIGDSVTTIGDYAFQSCNSLTNITIGKSVKTIGTSAFYIGIGCNRSVYITDLEAWCKIDFADVSANPLFRSWKDYCSTLYINGVAQSNITILDTITEIKPYAFYYCTSIKTITIPNSVTTIGNYAFYRCSSLTSVTIGGSVTTIGNSAFYNCDSLTSVIIGDSVTTIGNSAFYNCTSLTSVTIGDGVTSFYGFDFSQYGKLETLTIGSGIKEIPANYFADMTSLKTVNLSEGLEKIGDYAFSGCTYLETINIPDSVTFVGVEILKNTAWFNYRGKGLIVLDCWAYGYKGSDENVIVSFDETVKGIAKDTFKSQTNIIAFEVDENNSVYSSENGVLFNKNKTELIAYPCGKTDSEFVVPDTVEIIHSDAFYNCSNLRTLVIPDSVTTIGQEAFYNCSYLTSITIGNGIKTIGASAFHYDSSHYRYVYITDLEAWCKIDFANNSANPLNYRYGYLYINNSEASSIAIPDTITEIKPYAFYNCYSIKTLTIPDGVTTIGDRAFCDCNRLTSVTIPDSVTTIGNYAFYDCDSLTIVTLGDSVTTIGEKAFQSCDNLISITLSKDLQTIGYDAFSGCSKLRDVFYPGSQEDWGKVYIDSGNSYLTNADLFLMHKHDYTVTVTKEPTCTTAGEALYTCVHGDTKTEVIQPLGHTWDEGEITADSSCSKGGTKTYTCTVCFEKKYETIETLDHDYQLRDSYAPTCDKIGYDVYVCTQCSAKETRETAPSLGHDFSTEFTVDIDSTCTATGIKSKHCKRTGCTETTEETVIPLKDHAWQSEVTVTKVPTCTAEGESVILCKDCKIVKPESNKVIAPLGHNASEQEFTVDVKATCVSYGKQSKHCTRCNYIEQATQIPMSEHEYYVAEESTATCNKPGIAIYVCRMCKDSYTVENSPALGHDFEYIIIETPTCTREGYEYGDCTRCDATETRPVPTIDHDYVRTEVSPTCLDDGLATYTCSYGCGETYDEVIPAMGHSYPAVWIELLPATCTERGLSVKICSVCSDLQRQILPKLDHIDNDGDGVCDECGYGKETPDTPVHSHKYNSAIAVAPECETKGKMKFNCDCGYSYTEDIPALGHTEVIDKAVEATCSSTGLTEGKHCSVCQKVLVRQKKVDKLVHNYTSINIVPTCTAGGYTIYTCSMCGHSYKEEIPALAHKEVIDKAVEATCSSTGLTEGKHCSVCQTVLVKQQKVDKLVHNYISKNIVPTCTAGGYTTYTCSMCGHSYTEDIPAFGHTVVIDEAVEATCSSTGLTEGKHCDICGKVTIAQQEIAKKDHNDADGDNNCDMCDKELEVVKPEEKPCDCDCHAGGIKAFFFNFLNFFAKLFNKDARTCECGVAH